MNQIKIKIGLSVFTMLYGFNVFAGEAYPICYIDNGLVHAAMCTESSYSGSGTGVITTFNRRGRVLDRVRANWVAVAVMGCDEVETFEVADEAVFCRFEP